VTDYGANVLVLTPVPFRRTIKGVPMSSEPAVDPRGPRFAAGVTSVVLVLVLLGGSAAWWLLAIQTIIFAIGAFVSLRYSPYSIAFQSWVLPRLRPTSEREETPPLRFAQTVGFVFALVGLIGYLSGLTVLGTVATALALIAALLNAVFGLCLGCQMYLLIRRFAPTTGK
jgi:hypothetical protein